MEKEKIDYYQVGSKDDIVVSSSSLKHIDPSRGGSPQDFLTFMEEGFGETPSMKLGSLIHLWQEDPENFKIAEVTKPSEKMGLIADEIIKLVKEGNEYTEELIEYVIDKLEYQKNWKPETRLKKVIEEAHPYINEVLTATENNQVFLTASQLEPVQNACEAIAKHPVANDLLFHQETGFDNTRSFTEQEIFWTLSVLVEFDVFQDIKMKAKLDKIVVYPEKKLVKVIDLKTTSKGAHSYSGTNFKTYKNYQQLSFYGAAIKRFLSSIEEFKEIKDWKLEFYIVAVETNKTQQCVVYKVASEWIVQGNIEVYDLLRRIAWHQYYNKWSYSIEEESNGYILDLSYDEDKIQN